MTCFWLEGGQFFGFEGCNDKGGCCPLNCGHVWNYEQSLAFLFPSLERFMREVDFLNNTKDNGEMVFRTSLPLGAAVYWKFRPAADGSLGKIINLYRDWQMSGDMEFLKKLWPKAKKVLEYTWTAWDADKDGLIEGEQHNTYDIEFYGPNSMIGTFYLGALLAGSKMAEAVGDAEAAKTYRGPFEKGQDEIRPACSGTASITSRNTTRSWKRNTSTATAACPTRCSASGWRWSPGWAGSFPRTASRRRSARSTSTIS